MRVPQPLFPYVVITPQEAEQLAEAILNVAQYYDLGAVFNGKYFAIGYLAFTVGMIYVPRFGALQELKKQAANAQQPAGTMSAPQAPMAPLN